MPTVINNGRTIAIDLPTKDELATAKVEPKYDDKQKLVNLKFSYKKTGETDYTSHDFAVMPFNAQIALKFPTLVFAQCNLSTIDKSKALGKSLAQALEQEHMPRVSLECLESPVLLPSIEVPLASLLFNPHLTRQFDLSDFTVMSVLSKNPLARESYNAPDDFKLSKKNKGISADLQDFNKYLEKKANPSFFHRFGK
ncbi:MAG: hypothetical protein RLZZ210_508 [Pseudomonadota bacterium]|jgi:hypothetical protein